MSYSVRYITKDKKYRISRDFEDKGNYAYILEKKVWWGWKTISHGYTFEQCRDDLSYEYNK